MNHILPNKPQNNHLSNSNSSSSSCNNSSNKNSKDVNACKRVGSFKVDIKRKSHITRSKR